MMLLRGGLWFLNEHLMRDYGAMNLALALVLIVAGVTMDRLLVRTALCALPLFAVPHLIFHATHLEHFSTSAAITELATLTIAAALPAVLLALTRTTRDAGDRGSGGQYVRRLVHRARLTEMQGSQGRMRR